ncbi:MAG: DUF177 domain-containing protein [candidate division Zixibacteria bacterium]|nr:DUF177 domain-containing protein [candidate division Zixibacteria bacterium]
MILDLKHCEAFPHQLELTDETVRAVIGTDNIRVIKNLKLKLNVQNSDDEYFCQGRLEATVQLECARCVKTFEKQLVTDVDFIVAPEGRNRAKEENIIDDEDYLYYDNDLCADLWEILRQALILAVSMKPLCEENCRGFCSVCGGNRNKKQCNCRNDNSRNQFAELRNLL